MGGGRTLLQHCSAESYMVHVPDRLLSPRLASYLLPVSAQRNNGHGVDQSGRRDGNVGYPVHVRGIQRIHTALLHLGLDAIINRNYMLAYLRGSREPRES